MAADKITIVDGGQSTILGRERAMDARRRLGGACGTHHIANPGNADVDGFRKLHPSYILFGNYIIVFVNSCTKIPVQWA